MGLVSRILRASSAKGGSAVYLRTGVYKIPIKDNNENNPEITHNSQTKKQFYIGSTKRRLKSRLDEHIKNYQKNQEKTALIQYCNRNNTRPDLENITIVKKPQNRRTNSICRKNNYLQDQGQKLQYNAR